ncbi:MAG TPA: hypothetical protein VII53_07335 [Solirubrobacteraceae bacterium]
MSRTSPAVSGSAPRLLFPALVCALVLVCGGQALGATGQTGGSSQTGQPGATGSAPVISGTLEQCLSVGEQADRSATFSGEMTAVAGTARMAMRIEVQERMPGDTLFHTVSAPGLGVWRSSQPGVKIYKYVKQVTNLSSPAVYRALVRFHWLDGKGYVIKRAERHTPTCAQPVSPSSPSTPLE